MEGIPAAVGVLSAFLSDALDPGRLGMRISTNWWVDVKGDKSKKPIIATSLNN